MNKSISIGEFPKRTAPPVRSARERVGLRTRELAALAGRSPLDITQTDYEQAKREVTGESQPDKQDVFLDAAV
jgi:hypothetical protein